MSSDRVSEFARRILILFVHPALEKSRVQRRLLLPVQNLPGVTVHDLYETYPDLMIDAEREKQLLREHEVIVFQHPFYWYSSPALLKEWQDIVLQFGFAYGENGTELHGKVLMNAVSTGGSETAYRPDGGNQYFVRQLLAPFERTAHLCGMVYLPPFVVHGTHHIDMHVVDDCAIAYRKLLEQLRDGNPDDATLRELAARPMDNLPIINTIIPGLVGKSS